MKSSNAPKVMALAVAAVAVTACATPPAGQQYGGFRAIPPDVPVLQWTYAGLGGEADRLIYRDVNELNEYARYDDGPGRAEAVYISVVKDLHNNIVLDYSYLTQDLAERFSYLSGRTANWTKAEFVDTSWNKDAAYRQFDVPAENVSCVIFSSDWGHREDDQRNRPSYGAFGYYCGAPGTKLTKEQARAAIKGFVIKGVSAPLTVAEADAIKARPKFAVTADQAALVSVLREGNAGLASFPFRLVRHIERFDGRDRIIGG